MYGLLLACVIIVAVRTTYCDTLGPRDEVDCRPLPTAVFVSEHDRPHFVLLHRCQGSVRGGQGRKECRAKTTSNVDVVSAFGDRKRLLNHTSCEGKCADNEHCRLEFFDRDENTCHCTCKFQKYNCPVNHKWDPTTCSCQCTLAESQSLEKTLNKTSCRYMCTHRCPRGREHDENCKCRKKHCVLSAFQGEGSDDRKQGKLLAAVVIGEFLFLYLIFDFLLYSKKTGLIYNVKSKCQRNTRAKTCETSEERKRMESVYEANGNSEPVRVVVNENGTSHIETGPRQHVSAT